MTNSQLTNFHSNLSHRETFAIAIVLVHLVHLVLAFEKFQEFLRDSMMQHDATYGAGYASSSASLDSSFTEKHLQSLLLCSCTRCLAKRKAQTLCVIDVFHCVSLCFTVFHWKLLNSLDSFNPIDSAPCSESTVLHVPLSVWHHWIRRVSLFATILVTGESSFNGQPPPEIHKGSGVTGFLATVSSVPKPRVWSDYFLPSPEKSENQEVQ